ncbi:MAG: nucleotide sugar dehydrogenase [Candidatus Omnitrophica bacterium]|nr:nucleotide sugar dehydrogenase [Candidatus Omnitrophota bacterium]
MKAKGVYEGLKRKILSKKAMVSIVGQGYVGLPLACEFARAGFKTAGIDLSSRKVEMINRGRSPVLDVKDEEIAELVLKKKRLHASTGYDSLRDSDVIIICVPTPLNKARDPDISFIVSATKEVAKRIRRGQLVVLESTTYPGTTEELILPELSRKSFKAGRDFFLCFSPERIDPGNRKYRVANIPKVVGGVTKNCTELGCLFYGAIIEEVIPVSSTRVAEMSKLLENTFRIVNIGLINELAIVASRLGVNIWEAVRAAATKPFGYMPFYPGPGIGGHCIGVDPLYLSWKARVLGAEIRFIELANRMNVEMPSYVVERSTYALNSVGKSINGAKVLVLGVAYKRDVDDIRESPALEIISGLKKLGAHVYYHDPHVPELRINGTGLHSVALSPSHLRGYDLVLIVTDHSSVDYKVVFRSSRLILDTRNALGDIKGSRKKIVTL